MSARPGTASRRLNGGAAKRPKVTVEAIGRLKSIAAKLDDGAPIPDSDRALAGVACHYLALVIEAEVMKQKRTWRLAAQVWERCYKRPSSPRRGEVKRAVMAVVGPGRADLCDAVMKAAQRMARAGGPMVELLAPRAPRRRTRT